MANNQADLIAEAGIDLEAFKAGIEEISKRLDVLDKRSAKAEKGVTQISKSAQSLKNIVIADKFINVIDSITSKSGRASQALAGMDNSLNSQSFNALSASGVNLNAVLGRTIDITSEAPGRFGVYARAAGAAASIVQEWADENDRANAAVLRGAGTLDGYIEKQQQLNAALQEQLTDVSRNATVIQGLEDARKNNADAYVKQAEAELEAGKKKEVGAQKDVELLQLQAEKRQQIADLEASLRDKFGQTSPAGNEILKAGTQIIERNIKLREREVDYSKTEQEEAKRLNNFLSERGVTIQDQLSQEILIQSSLERQTAEAKRLYGAHSLIVSALAAQLRDSEIRYDNIQFERDQAQAAAKSSTAQREAELAGNKKLAAEYKIRAQFAAEITKQQRLGNKEVVQELKNQQQLAILEARVADKLKTPGERRRERKEQRRSDRAVRTVDAQDRVRAENRARGAYGQRSSRDYVSPSAARAREAFVKRNGGDVAGARNQAVATMQVASLQVGSIESK